MSDEIRPFSCGSQYGDWRSRNCDKCTKGYHNHKPEPKNGMGPCDIDNAIGMAYLGSGSVAKKIAERMGFASSLEYSWACPERELIPPKPPTVEAGKDLPSNTNKRQEKN